MLFSWDDVVADTRGLQRRAWRRLAKEEDLRWPEVERQLYDVRPERVIIEVPVKDGSLLLCRLSAAAADTAASVVLSCQKHARRLPTSCGF